MSDQKKEMSQRAISGNFEVTLALSTSRQMKITGYLFTDDTIPQINERIDATMDVLDRQGIRSDLVNKEAQIAANEANLNQMQEQIDKLLNKKKSRGGKLSSADEQALANFPAQLEAVRGIIASFRHAIDAGKKKLNGAHAG